MKKLLLFVAGLSIAGISEAAIISKKVNLKADQNGAEVTVANCRVNFAKWADFQIDRFGVDLGLAAAVVHNGMENSELLELKAGDVIDAARNYFQPIPMSSQSALHITNTGPGQPAPAGSYYFGLRGHANDKVADVRYGWMKITIAANGDVTVDSIAFNDQPNASIKAGQASATTTDVADVTKGVFSIYPNPVKNALNINAENGTQIKTVTVFNTVGQIVKQNNNTAAASFITVPLDNMIIGNYFLKIESKEGKLEYHQFIKE